MEAKNVPRLSYAEDLGRFHPRNVLAFAVNTIVRLESFRQGMIPELGPSAFVERMQAKNEELEANFDVWRAQQLRIVALGSRAGEDPEHFREPYLEELKGYHNNRVAELGVRVTALEVEKPKFVGMRKWFVEKRQAYHQKRSATAARKLIEFAFS